MDRLNALCNQLPAQCFRDIGDSAQHLSLLEMIAGTMGKVFVDLDEFGLKLGPQAKARAAVAKIVQSEFNSRPAKSCGGGKQFGKIGDAIVFSDLNYELSAQ